MEAILNKSTRTAHKPKVGTPEQRSLCGVTRHLAPDQIQTLPLEEVSTDTTLKKCGRCFEEAGGY